MSQVTVTADTGPGVTVTAHVFENLKSISFDLDANTFTVVYNNTNRDIRHFSLEGVTTISCSISGTTFTWTVS